MNKKTFSILLFLLSSVYACATLCSEFKEPDYPSKDSLRNKLKSWQDSVERNPLLKAQLEESCEFSTDETDILHGSYDMYQKYGSLFGHKTPYAELEYRR